MFEKIRKCLDEYEDISCNRDIFNLSKEEIDAVQYFELHFAKALMQEDQRCLNSEKIAKIILATKGLSNEISIKVD